MLSVDDRDLLDAFVRARSNEAFRRLVERYLGFVIGIALRQTRSQPLAEEVAQNVLAILARKAEAIRPEALPAWLHRTTLHQSYVAMRSESRHRRKLAALAAGAAPASMAVAEPRFDDETLRALDESLTRLRKADQCVLLLRFFEGQTFPEIARRLGQSEAAVQRRGHRALERLGLMLRRRGVALSTAGLASAFSALPTEASPILAARIATRALTMGPQLSATTLLTHALYTMSTATKIAAGIVLLGTLAAAPVAIRFGSHSPRALEAAVIHNLPASHPPSGAAEAPRPGVQAATVSVRLGRGKQRYSLEEATRISQRIVERLEINGSRAIHEKVLSLSLHLREGVLDPDDWDEIEKAAGAKRRTQDPDASREVLMERAAAAFLDHPGRDRGGPLAFVAYHLKRLEMLPAGGTPEEQEAYDWVRAKACVDRGVFEGRSPEALTELEQVARKYPGELVWNAALMRAYFAQSDWKRALTLAEEAVSASKFTDPERTFAVAGQTFRHEAEASGGGGWMAYFAAAPNSHPGYLSKEAANKLFDQGMSLQTADAEMADRCWRSSIGMLHLLETDRAIGMRLEALGDEKRMAKKLPDEAMQSIYDRPAADARTQIDAEFANLRSLMDLHHTILKSGDEAKIQQFKAAVAAEGNFAVLDRMRRAQQE